MSNQFLHIVESASANKQAFDSSMAKLQNSLDASIQQMKDSASRMDLPEAKVPQYTTGWLRGALSYPWMVVWIIIPAVFDTLM